MYAIKEIGSRIFFYGIDHKYYPPRAKVSKMSHIMQFYGTEDEARTMLKNIVRLTGRVDFEVVELKYRILQ